MMEKEKKIELRPVSREEVDRILKGEMIELSNAACGSAGGYGSCGGSAGSCGGSAGSCGGCGGCGCGSGNEETINRTGHADSPEIAISSDGCPYKAKASVDFEYQITRRVNQYGDEEFADERITYAKFAISFAGDSRTEGETTYSGHIQDKNASKVQTTQGSGNSVSAGASAVVSNVVEVKKKKTITPSSISALAVLTVHFERGGKTIYATCSLS